MVKSILFRYGIKGKGIVNYDSSEQKNIHNKYDSRFGREKNNNTNYGKKDFFEDKDGKLYWKIKISSNCLRQNIFQRDAYSQSPSILKDDNILYSFISSPASLLRGYTFVNASTNLGLKRKSAIEISSATQTNNSISYIETHCKTGNKDNGMDDVASDTLFYKETIGDIEYGGEGHIDLMQLCFISCSQEFDRYSFNPDHFNLYSKYLKFYLSACGVEVDLKIGNYMIKNSTIKLSEEGILLPNKVVNVLVREFFDRLIKLNIRRAGAHAVLSSLEYKLVEDPLEDTISSEKGWVSIKNKHDIQNINFDMDEFYIESSDEDVENTKLKVEEFNERDKKIRSDKKDQKKKKSSEKSKENNKTEKENA